VVLVAAYPRVAAQLGAAPKRIDLRYPTAGGRGGKAPGTAPMKS